MSPDSFEHLGLEILLLVNARSALYPEESEGMAKKKRYRGHYCKICSSILPNEKFSGKGHAVHICRACAKIPEEKQEEQIALNRIFGVYRYLDLSRDNRRMLEEYSQSPNERIRSAALETLSEFKRPFLWENPGWGEEDWEGEDREEEDAAGKDVPF
jgi:hypothetical protein